MSGIFRKQVFPARGMLTMPPTTAGLARDADHPGVALGVDDRKPAAKDGSG